MPAAESVLSYPRPPRIAPVPQVIRVEFAAHTIAKTTRALRVLETTHPPVYYVPKQDILRDILIKTEHHTFCEWKGHASYWTIDFNNKRSENAAWSYEDPTPGFEGIRGYLAFYAGKVDACFVGDEQIQPQCSSFYGGWITSNLTGLPR